MQTVAGLLKNDTAVAVENGIGHLLTPAGGQAVHEASVRRRRSNGFEYLASYTLSRTQTNNPGFFTAGGVAFEGA